MIALVAPVSAAALAGSVTWAVASPPPATSAAAAAVASRNHEARTGDSGNGRDDDEGRDDEGRDDEGRSDERRSDGNGSDGNGRHESERRRVKATTSHEGVKKTTNHVRDGDGHDVRDDDPHGPADGDEHHPRPGRHAVHRVAAGAHPAPHVVRAAGGPHDDGSLVVTVTSHHILRAHPLTLTFKAMASKVTLQVVDPGPAAPELLEAARRTFARVEASCTRFDPDSPLMRANAAGDGWQAVPVECYRALAEAVTAHTDTGGLFDPRVLETLKDLGYDRTLPFGSGPVRLAPSAAAPSAAAPSTAAPAGATPPPTGTATGRATGEATDKVTGHATGEATGPAGSVGATGSTGSATDPWRPGFDAMRGRVRIGPRPVDLGGIGKGLAVRWAAESLAYAGRAHLVEAGGDCHLGGHGPDGTGWRVAVEDPRGGTDPIAVLTLGDTGCATSSVRVRSWRLGGRRVHHLIDPRTGAPADAGLAAVTVVEADPARAEVWSKALLVAGRSRIAELANRFGLAALWMDVDGRLDWTASLAPALTWVGADVA